MRVSSLILAVLPLAISSASARVITREDSDAAKVHNITEGLKARVLDHVDAQAAKTRACGKEPSCTRDKLVFRKE